MSKVVGKIIGNSLVHVLYVNLVLKALGLLEWSWRKTLWPLYVFAICILVTKAAEEKKDA